MAICLKLSVRCYNNYRRKFNLTSFLWNSEPEYGQDTSNQLRLVTFSVAPRSVKAEHCPEMRNHGTQQVDRIPDRRKAASWLSI